MVSKAPPPSLPREGEQKPPLGEVWRGLTAKRKAPVGQTKPAGVSRINLYLVKGSGFYLVKGSNLYEVKVDSLYEGKVSSLKTAATNCISAGAESPTAWESRQQYTKTTPAEISARVEMKTAATYSPTGVQYHRRGRA